MELLAVLHVLWRRRLLVALGALAAIAIGVLVTRGEPSRTGIATTRVILDTPDSLIVRADPPGAETLEWRSVLLVDLMATPAAVEQVAREVGVPADQVAVVIPALTVPERPLPLAERALETAATRSEPYQLSVHTDSADPIISIDASAPTRAGAARLAGAAIRALRSLATASPPSPEVQELQIEQVRPIASHVKVTPTRRIPGPAIAFLLFAAWCSALAVAASLARRVAPERLSRPAALRH